MQSSSAVLYGLVACSALYLWRWLMPSKSQVRSNELHLVWLPDLIFTVASYTDNGAQRTYHFLLGCVQVASQWGGSHEARLSKGTCTRTALIYSGSLLSVQGQVFQDSGL